MLNHHSIIHLTISLTLILLQRNPVMCSLLTLKKSYLKPTYQNLIT